MRTEVVPCGLAQPLPPSRPLQPVRERHANTFRPCRVAYYRGWRDRHRNVPLADAARRLRGDSSADSSSGYRTRGSPSTSRTAPWCSSFKTARRIQKRRQVQPAAVPIEHRVVGWTSVHNINKSPTWCKLCSLIYFTAKSLYMFRVSQHPSSGVLKTVTAASGTGSSWTDIMTCTGGCGYSF